MAWTNPQKANVVRACEAAGIADQRELILRQLGGRAEHPPGSGRITSTAPRLTQGDYEQTMAVIEQSSGGQIQTRTKDGKHVYRYGHWAGRASNGALRRQRQMIDTLVTVLRGTPSRDGGGPVLDADGQVLQGVIRRATRQQAETLGQLDAATASAVIDALKQLGKRHGVQWNANMAS